MSVQLPWKGKQLLDSRIIPTHCDADAYMHRPYQQGREGQLEKRSLQAFICPHCIQVIKLCSDTGCSLLHKLCKGLMIL